MSNVTFEDFSKGKPITYSGTTTNTQYWAKVRDLFCGVFDIEIKWVNEFGKTKIKKLVMAENEARNYFNNCVMEVGK